MDENATQTPWTRHGRTVWCKTRSQDRRVADCDTEVDAALIAEAPALLAMARELVDELHKNRDDIFQNETVAGNETTLSNDAGEYLASMDERILRARLVIRRATRVEQSP